MRLRLVFVTVFVIAACGLGYELVTGATASLLLGETVTQFSVTIGLFMFAMGVGAWLSKFLDRQLIERFIDVQLSVALIGGTSAAALMLVGPHHPWFRPLLYAEILVTGTLVGLEIPLLLRILKPELEFKDLVSYVLTFDYIGALAVALIFPFVLVQRAGPVGSAVVFGLLNAGVALWTTWLFAGRLRRTFALRARCVVVICALAALFALREEVQGWNDDDIYADPVVHAETTPYQRIVVTQNRAGFQLFLNGALQFSSADEYRYHEALVHPAMAVVPEGRRVLVLGGGDGLAVREVLRHARVERVTLVDIDARMTAMARTYPALAELNGHALDDPRVKVVTDDALHWLENPDGIYDVLVCDFPDPTSFSLGKLYTTHCYRAALKCLAPDGAIVVQSTSPLFARRTFWCVVKTLEACDLTVRPYHVAVPSFGLWGFALAKRQSFEPPRATLPGLRFLNEATLPTLFALPQDLAKVEVEVNRLDNQVLVHYCEQDWKKWE
jgi:spermidine synthase